MKDILPSELVKRLQDRVSIFNKEEDEKRFAKMLEQFTKDNKDEFKREV